MTAHLFFRRAAAFLRTLLVCALLWAATGGGAYAQMVTISSVTVNGSTSTVNVAPGTVVNIAVTFQNGGQSWSMTSFSFTPGGPRYCVLTTSGVLTAGTTTRVFRLAAPTGSNLYSLAVASHTHSACKIPTPPGHLVSGTYNFRDAVNTKPVVVGVDHLQIEHDGIGRTCGPKTVTIRACADAACSTSYTLATTITLTANNSGTWAPATQTFSGGTTTAQLSKNATGIVTMGGSISSPTPKSTVTTCLKSGVLGSCDVDFSPSSCRLDAVEANKNPGTPIFTKTTAGFALDVVNLNTSGALANTTATILARLVDDASCAAGATQTFLSPEVSGSFNNASRVSFTFAPATASRSARVRITNGTLTGCSTDKFAIRPASFTVTAPAANADGTGASALATPVLKAGTTAFTLTAVSATGYSGAPDINNDRLDAANVDVTTAGVGGNLAGAFAAGAGTASGSFTYSEAGYVRLLPYAVYDNSDFTLVDSVFDECRKDDGSLIGTGAIADGNVPDATGKVACYFGNTQTAYFGRFIPDRFVLGAATLKDRSALACIAPGFTYMGEAMQASVALTPVNGSGVLTENYVGKFHRLTSPSTQLGIDAVDDTPAPLGRTAFPVCGTPKAHPCIEVGAVGTTFLTGTTTYTVPLTLLRPGARVGPFDNLKVGVAPVDLDAVKLDPASYNLNTLQLASAPNNHALVAATKARYGRLSIDNAYGSELLNLWMGVRAQYWFGTGAALNPGGWVTNQLDSCTPLAKANFVLPALGYRGGITSTNMDQTHIIGGNTLINGAGRVMLSKPTPAPITTGSAVLRSLNPILPGSGRGTFGVYKAGPVIYVRETY